MGTPQLARLPWLHFPRAGGRNDVLFQAMPLTFHQPVSLHPACSGAASARGGTNHTAKPRVGVARTNLARVWAVCTPTKGPGDGNGGSVHSYLPRPASASAGRMFPLEGVTSAPAQVGAFYSRGKRCQLNELEAANADLGQRQTCEN
jgi:hypothetical protein